MGGALQDLIIKISIADQLACLLRGNELVASYLVSTGKNGIGQLQGSEKTPLGLHEICEKYGADLAQNTVFRHRKPTGEIYTPHLNKANPGRDWIITRILRLNGLEEGHNLGGDVDSYQRCIYFHGAPDESPMGVPASHGCIRMHNWNITELFNWVPIGTKVLIEA